MDFTRSQGIADTDVRLLVRTFMEKAADQKPKLWQKDFEERARSQNWTEHEKEIERIAAIRDEIIYNCLPEGFSADQVDDATRIIRLNNGQKLHIYQAMCRQFEKDEYDTIPECLYELKYVIIGGKRYVAFARSWNGSCSHLNSFELAVPHPRIAGEPL
jgi:hypothetical protein